MSAAPSPLALPTLDLTGWSGAQGTFVEELGQSFRRHGFVGIRGHGVPPALIQRNYAVARALFALPEAVKRRYEVPGQAGQRGYTRFGVETARTAVLADLKEFWHVGRECQPGAPEVADLAPNLWPREVEGFRSATRELYAALEILGGTLLQAIALFLGQEKDFFASAIQRGNSILRPIHYPPVPGEATAVRSAAHEDINLITLLVGASAPGLEILTRQGYWLPVNTSDDTIVVNVGDMLQRWCNHRLISTTHRVVNPLGEESRTSRLSIPFFLHLNPDWRIETLQSCVDDEHPDRYPEPIRARDYLWQRLEEIGLTSEPGTFPRDVS